MNCTVKTISLHGIDGFVVNIEVDIDRGIPAFIMVGLAEQAVKESKERVRAAIKNSGYEIKVRKTTINFAPADVRKEGTHLDLAIAIGILACNGLCKTEDLSKMAFVGELSLNGELRPVKGILPMVLEAKAHGFQSVVIPFENRNEVDFLDGINVYCAAYFKDVIYFLNRKGSLIQTSKTQQTMTNRMDYSVDFNEIKGHRIIKRAVEIAASGMHNLAMIGPPGSGKTMIAQRIPSILPELSQAASIEATKIYSVAGLLKEGSRLVTSPPFRSPHHSASTIAIVGGGASPVPGEISLAHKGVLFLDEFPEHKRSTIEALRQPLEDGLVSISRIKGRYQFPSSFMLVISMNPCPCGNFGYERKECRCTTNQIKNYLTKLSGPIIDRIDLHLSVEPVSFLEINSTKPEESSETIRQRVAFAQEVQKKRYLNDSIEYNSQMTSSHLRQFCCLNQESLSMLEKAFRRMLLSSRAYTKILKVARTIADMQGADRIESQHLAEALQYRHLDRNQSS